MGYEFSEDETKRFNRVSIEAVFLLEDIKRSINKIPLDDIIWTENGKEVKIAPNDVKEFKFTGLNNVDFILTGAYKREETK